VQLDHLSVVAETIQSAGALPSLHLMYPSTGVVMAVWEKYLQPGSSYFESNVVTRHWKSSFPTEYIGILSLPMP